MMMKKIFLLLLGGVILLSASVATGAMTDNLVVHLKFDGDTNDSSGQNNNGTASGGPTFVAGFIGTNALDFDGGDDYVTLGNPTDLQFGTSTDFSISAWVLAPSTSGDPSIISNKNWASGGNVGYILSARSSDWKLNYCGTIGSRLDLNAPVLDGTWRHIAVTFKRSGNVTVYMNGSEVTNSGISGTGSIDAGLDTAIGQDGTLTYGGFLDATVDDVGFWRRELTPGEVLGIYQSGLAGTDLANATEATIFEATLGPYVHLTEPGKATLRWETTGSRTSVVEYGPTEALGTREEVTGYRTSHEVILTGLAPKTKYFYHVGGALSGEGEAFTETHKFDSALNYGVIDCSAATDPYTPDALTSKYQDAATYIINTTGIKKGLCIVYGCGEGRLAFELAKRSDLKIVGVDENQTDIDTARSKLREAGVYGTRVTVHQASSLAAVDFTKYLARLIVSDRMISDGTADGDATEMFRVLRPSGGVAMLGQPTSCPNPLSQATLESWLDAGSLSYTTTNDGNGLWSTVTRDKLTGAGEWVRQYGDTGNTACNFDDMEGATGSGDLELQWIGMPGGDFGADRNPRMPAPMMVNGRLYHQGLDRLLAMDAYSGVIYWTIEAPEMLRVNMPRDSGYTSADDDDLYIAVKDKCWVLNGDTGLLGMTHDLDDPGYEWGYVALSDTLLFGSAQYEGAHYTNIFGGGSAGWYDAATGAVTDKVCSKYLFANNKTTGSRDWTYQNGVILNSTICIGGGRVYFVECRDATIGALTSGRIGQTELWSSQYLVALNETNGNVIYEEPINTYDGTTVFYLDYCAYDSGTLVLASSAPSSYYVYTYVASSGADYWGKSENHAWLSDNHGVHMQHPAVTSDRIFLTPEIYALSNGNSLGTVAGQAGCASMALGSDLVIYRNGSRQLGLSNHTGGSTSAFSDLRPSCWLSAIPAGGMLLAPEGGGGCSCGNWFEASMGFVKY